MNRSKHLDKREHILLATLGGQPQIVTFTLDLLLKTYPITQVIVLHPRTTTPRLQQALTRLKAEFAGLYHTTTRTIHFRSHELKLHGRPIDDIIDDQHADGTLDTIQQLISDLKHQRLHIHFSATGGRRLMSLLAIAVAMLNFDRYDHIWHIYTPQTIQDQAKNGTIMHVAADAGIQLIEGPFISLGAYIPNSGTSFRTRQDEQRLQIEVQQHTVCAQVVKKATPAQIQVLQAFSQGLTTQQAAAHLGISPNTVNTHKKALLELCRNAWDIAPGEPLTYHFFANKFATYFDQSTHDRL